MGAELVLGTAQLGSAYGVGNAVGALTDAQVTDVLDAAAGSGVRLLDTAEAYGFSERRIGDYRRANGDVFKVCTKLSGGFEEAGEDLSCQIRRRVQAASVRLFAPSIFLYYLHSFEMCRNEGLLFSLESERHTGSLEHVGVSVYEPSELQYLLDNASGIVDAVQIPLNVFNCAQWLEGDLLEEACKQGVMLLARSVYLQGIVFKCPDDLTAIALGLDGSLRQFGELCADLGMSPAELACAFVASEPAVEYVVLGSETPGQVRENAALLDKARALGPAERERIVDMSSRINQDALDPRRWPALLGGGCA